MVGIMKVMVTSFKSTCARTVVFSVPDPAAGHCGRLLDTQRQVWLSLLWGHCSFLLAPGVHKVLSVSPVLWKFCNQIPLAYRVKFPGSSQSLCPIPRLAEFDIKFLVYIWQLDEYHVELFHSFEFILMCMLKKCLKSRNLSGLYWQLPRGKLRAIPCIAFGSLNGRDT